MKSVFFLSIVLCSFGNLKAQYNPLILPPVLSGTNFNLTVQSGTTQFWPGINTTTYGINGAVLAPTLIWNQGDSVNISVTNSLPGAGNSTTIHWHGLHVPPEYDGGPHQVIAQGATWNPKFKILNDAGTFWYHPHGLNKTDRHVSKGVAGFIIIKDPLEAALNLPRTYGIDDFPLCMQTKEFDVLNQIAIATFMDTAIMMNATVNAYQNMPAQVVRLRLLNGASQRSFLVGFSNNMNFSLIGNDGGLLPAPVSMNRLLLSNGERAEILVDLGSMLNDTLYLRCYGSELPNGIYGADSVGDAGVNQIPDYYNNTLNGVDFDLLQIRVVAQTSTPVTSIPTTLIPYTAPVPDAQTQYRKLVIDTIGSMAITPNLAAGPFAFNQELFDMDSINEVVILNSKEVWTIQNKSMIAHPFHIHDIQFSILDVNGGPVPDYEKGKKDVVLIMPGDSVRFITEFKDFANDSIPYMYHCHILHHEDDGMMGSFLVIDTSVAASVLNPSFSQHYIVYPNPANQHWQICSNTMRPIGVISLYNLLGQLVYQDTNPQQASSLIVPATHLPSGMYYLKIDSEQHSLGTTLVRE